MSEVPATAPPPPPPPPREVGPVAKQAEVDYAPAPPIGPAYGASPAASAGGSPAQRSSASALAEVANEVAAEVPAPVAGPVSDVADGGSAAPSTPVVGRRRLRWLWWTSGSLVFAALAGLSAYLAVVSQQWSARVDDLTAISEDLGTQVATQSEARKTAEAEAKTLKGQLDTATARITDLANEEANATDHEALWMDLVDALISCADARQQVIDAYANNLVFDGISRTGRAAEVTAYCDGLKSDYANFKAEIGK